MTLKYLNLTTVVHHNEGICHSVQQSGPVMWVFFFIVFGQQWRSMVLLCANKLHPALATQTILVRRVSLDLLTKKKEKIKPFISLTMG